MNESEVVFSWEDRAIEQRKPYIEAQRRLADLMLDYNFRIWGFRAAHHSIPITLDSLVEDLEAYKLQTLLDIAIGRSIFHQAFERH